MWRTVVADPDPVPRDAGSPCAGADPSLHGDLEPYLRDVDRYLEGLLVCLPNHVARRMRVTQETARTHEARRLAFLAAQGATKRIQYEARRKLYLGKLLFDIDHARSVQDGPRHRAHFDSIIRRGLWGEGHDERVQEVCCRLTSIRSGEQGLEVGVPRAGDARCWTFRVRPLRSSERGEDIEVFDYRSRFKRDGGSEPDAASATGHPSTLRTAVNPGLGKRSGSILSKMIRRGIADAQLVPDLLGAMFIVRNRQQARLLERRLIALFGGPLRWRDRVDTLHGRADRERLDRRSSDSFRVLKSIVDVLMPDPAGRPPYLVSVEVQIYPLGSYLRTVHDGHFANHAAYKRRQTTRDLLPTLYPVEVYGAIQENAYLPEA